METGQTYHRFMTLLVFTIGYKNGTAYEKQGSFQFLRPTSYRHDSISKK